ncbi:TerC family protein [Paenibacillus turpanensis]|uniref:TerC family protein n=1 Tax=Paenibacillus turpanensis TaxID=2689078 RepID=UPI001409AB17|nr:hypothetical protein [Paenibacillus turpanensis]
MDLWALLEYTWVFLLLIGIEGLAAAVHDKNLRITTGQLIGTHRKKAVFYGVTGAFLFRPAALILVVFSVSWWQTPFIGSALLLISAGAGLALWLYQQKLTAGLTEQKRPLSYREMLFRLDVRNLAFALSTIFAAVAVTLTLPPSGFPRFGEQDTLALLMLLFTGLIGAIWASPAGNMFRKLLRHYSSLQNSFYWALGWIGFHLLLTGLSNPASPLPPGDFTFAHQPWWKLTFYCILLLIPAAGIMLSKARPGK